MPCAEWLRPHHPIIAHKRIVNSGNMNHALNEAIHPAYHIAEGSTKNNKNQGTIGHSSRIGRLCFGFAECFVLRPVQLLRRARSLYEDLPAPSPVRRDGQNLHGRREPRAFAKRVVRPEEPCGSVHQEKPLVSASG